MPILGFLAPTATGTTPAGAATAFPQPPSITWTTADGIETLTLTDDVIVLMPGMQGLDMPTFTHYSTASPGVAGAMWQGVHVEPRDVFLPVYLESDTRAGAIGLRRELMRAFDPTKGPGTLTVTESDGSVRHLDAIYVSGMEGSEGLTEAGLTWVTYGIRLTAFDSPFWYGDPVQPVTWAPGAPVNVFPMGVGLWRLSSSQVLGSTIAHNAGDVDAWPVWTVNGPCTSVTLDRGDGNVLTLTHTLAAGHHLVIDTHPRAGTIVDDTGANLWAGVADGSALWSLPPGDTAVSLTVAGSGTGTSVQMTYQPQYLKS